MNERSVHDKVTTRYIALHSVIDCRVLGGGGGNVHIVQGCFNDYILTKQKLYYKTYSQLVK